MSDIASLILAAALVNNVVFVQLLGVSAVANFSERLQPAIDIAIFTAVVLILSSTINQLLFWFILSPLGLEMLKLIVFIGISSILATVLARIVRENFKLTARQQPIGFYLAGINSAVVGVSLLNSSITPSLTNFLNTVAVSAGSALGFAFVLVGLGAIKIRLSTSDAPDAFRHNPVMLISAGIAAMSFLGFAGLF
jgi:electron transport complex protein RnfA|tara:strand:+ start:1877 stop:2461 length:585 start_codon:yes stop_codon:yes gene_type:complete